jgi:signal transduction histidine kinase
VITLQTRKQIPITTVIDTLPALPLDVKVAFYRISQEALNNVAKHSQATQIGLALKLEPDAVSLWIKDNGTGFDPSQKAPTSYGLRIMYERAEQIGATLHIESQTGQGTTITVVWSQEGLLLQSQQPAEESQR